MKPYLPPDEFRVPDPPRDLSRKDRARRLAVDAIEASGDVDLANDLRRARLRGDTSAPRRNGAPFAPPGFRLVFHGLITEDYAEQRFLAAQHPPFDRLRTSA